MCSVLPQTSFMKSINESAPEASKASVDSKESSSPVLMINHNPASDNSDAASNVSPVDKQIPSEPMVEKESPDHSEASQHEEASQISPREEASQAQSNLSPNSPSVKQTKKETGKYLMVRTIGKGNFAKVKLAVHISTGVEVAIKIINKTQMKPNLLSRLKREIDIMKLTNHPNIVRLLEIIETEDVLCLVMEYASGGEIFDYLVTNGQISEKEARAKFRQLVSAIHYCHSKKIVHRDLKAENILLDGKLDIKVADFGLANKFERDGHLKTFCGSPPYAAPELFLGVPYFGPCVDIWSLGVILYTIVVGHLPFEAKDIRELKAKVLGLNYSFPKNSVSPEFKSIVGKMLILDPRKRSSLKTIMEHPWINMGYENDPLKPYEEARASELHNFKIEAMRQLGYSYNDLESSVVNPKFDHIYATYQLLTYIPSQIGSESSFGSQEAASVGKNEEGSSLNTNKETPSNLSPVLDRNSSSSKSSTTVGRFVVEASHAIPTSEVITPQKTKAASREDLNLANNSGNTSNIASHEKQHHSYTSSSTPNAIRRALGNFGRNLQLSEVKGSPSESVTEHSFQPKLSASKRNPKNYMLSLTTAPVPLLLQQQQQRCVKSMVPGMSTSGGIIPANPSSLNASPPSGIASPMPRRSSYHPSSLVSQVSHPGNPTESLASPRNQQANTTTWHSGNTKVLSLLQKHFQHNSESSNTQGSSTGTSGRHTPQKHSYQHQQQQPQLNATSQQLQEHGIVSQNEDVASNSTFSSIFPRANHRSFAAGRVHGVSSSHALLSLNRSTHHASIPEATEIVNKGSFQISKVPELKEPHEAVPSEEVINQIPALPTPSSQYLLDSNRSGTKLLKTLGSIFSNSRTTKTPGIRQLSNSSKSQSRENKPCEAVFPWSMSSTSTKSPQQMLETVKEALNKIEGVRWLTDAEMPYLIHCTWKPHRPSVQNAKLLWTKDIRRQSLKLESNSSPSKTNNESVKGQSDCVSQKDHHSPSRLKSAEDSHQKSCNDLTATWEAENMSKLDPGDPIIWEMHICKLHKTSLYGIRLNRIKGAAIEYKKVAGQVMKAMNL